MILVRPIRCSSILLLLLTYIVAHGQVNATTEIGIVPYGSYHGGDIDNVDLKSGNLFAQIPLWSLPQIGNLSLSLSMILNNSGYSVGSFCDTVEAPDYNGDSVSGVSDTACWPYVYRSTTFGPALSFDQSLWLTNTGGQTGSVDWEYSYGAASIFDATGAGHRLGSDVSNTTIFRANDGSGYTWASAPSSTDIPEGTIYTPSGLAYTGFTYTGYAPSGIAFTESVITDTNGNAINIGQPTDQAAPAGLLSSGSQSAAGSQYPAPVGLPAGVEGPGPFGRTITDSLGRIIPDLYNSPMDTQTADVKRCPSVGQANQQPDAIQTWNVPGPNGNTVAYQLCYTTITVNTNFLGGWWARQWADGNGNYDPLNDTTYYADFLGTGEVIQSIILPNGTFWGFIYDSSGPPSYISGTSQLDATANNTAYGDITKIIYPTGGSVSYDYYKAGVPQATFACFDNIVIQALGISSIAPRVVNHRTLNDGFNPSLWTYQFALTSGGYATTVVDPTPSSGENVSSTVHTFTDPSPQACAFPETGTQRFEGAAAIQTVSTTYYNVLSPEVIPPIVGTPNGGPGLTNILPRVVTTMEAGGSTTTTYSYPPLYSDETLIYEGAKVNSHSGPATILFSQPMSTTLVGIDGATRATKTIYKWQDNYLATPFYSGNVLNAVEETCTSGASSTDPCTEAGQGIGSAIQYFYGDSYSPYHQVNTQQLLNKSWLTTRSLVYDSYGRVGSVTDANGNSTSSTYGSEPGCYHGQPSPFPIRMQRPLMPIEHYCYDDNTGNLLSHTDVNAKTTHYQFDVEGRPTLTSSPDGGSIINCYTDVGGASCSAGTPPFQVVTVAAAAPNPNVITTTSYDGLGRRTQTAISSAPGGSIITDTSYDALGRVRCSSNPHTSGGASSDGQTCTTYDALNRKVVQVEQDQGTMQWCYDGLQTDGQANCSGNLSSVGATSWVDATDEVGNHTQQVSDGLGRLVSALEPSPNGAGAMETDYGYDALGNLQVVVQQGSGSEIARLRSFSYDSMSRILCASNPENSTASCPSTATSGWVAGTTGYTYDPNGNLRSKTDSRGVLTSYSYDSLNRLVSKTYSDDSALTPSSCYQYDAVTTTNGWGRLAQQWTQPYRTTCPTTPPAGAGVVSRKLVTAYDALGRVLGSQQCVLATCVPGGTSFQLSLNYDLAGKVSQVIQSGVPNVPQLHLSSNYDGAGRLSSMQSSWDGTPNSNDPLNIFSIQSYSPAGPQSWTLGDHLNLQKTYDARFRPTSETVTHP